MDDKQQKDQPVSTTTGSNTDLIIAYKGGLELLDAKWDLFSGRTVKFRLVEEPGRPIIMHPFNQFTRRRGNRVGSRFYVSMSESFDENMVSMVFTGEAMLMSGGQPLGQGFWVSFWLDDEASHHPFAGRRGRKGDVPGDIFMAAFVELDDDDKPIDQKKRARAEGSNKGQRLSVYSALLCGQDMFHQYLHERVTFNNKQIDKHRWASKDMAARYIRWKCGIESRSDLDRDSDAAEIFHKEIREPYRDWRGVHE